MFAQSITSLPSLSRRQRSCPRRPLSALLALPPPEDTAGLSHDAAAIEQGVPIAAGRSGGETSKTSGQRLRAAGLGRDAGLGARRESRVSKQVLARAGRQMLRCNAWSASP